MAADEPAALAAELARAGFDVLAGTLSADGLDVIASERERTALCAFGLTPVLVEEGRPFREIARAGGEEGAVPSGYPDLAAIEAALADAALAHPGLCRFYDLTATYGVPPTHEGRHLVAVKVSDDVGAEEDEPACLIVAAHHSRELVTPVIALEVLARLLSLYGTDPVVTQAVDENEIWIAPLWNPDGYAHVFDVDHFWRKNRRPFTSSFGVDLNRNYDFGWDSACGGSAFEASETFRGPAAASEAETRTMVLFSDDRRFAKVIDLHSSGREVLHGYLCHDHPLAAYLEAEAAALATACSYGGAEREPSAEGEHYEWQLARRGAFAFLIETATAFQPTYASALLEADLVWPGIRGVLAAPVPVRGHVVDARTGAPVAARITLPELVFANGEGSASGGAFGSFGLFLPAGTHALRFSALGYFPEERSVAVPAAGGVALEVALFPRPGPRPGLPSR